MVGIGFVGLIGGALLATQSMFSVSANGMLVESQVYVDDMESESVEETENVQLPVVYYPVNDPLFASENKTVLEEILRGVNDISASLSSSDVPDVESEVSVFTVNSYSSSTLPDSGVVVITGSIDGRACTLILPEERYESLWVDASGYLHNVSGTDVVGRCFYDNTFDSGDYLYHVYNLPDIYGDANNVYRYGSLNYLTDYYVSSSGNLSSSKTYVNMIVDEMYVARAPSLEYKSYIIMLGIFFLVGGIVIWSYRSSFRW